MNEKLKEIVGKKVQSAWPSSVREFNIIFEDGTYLNIWAEPMCDDEAYLDVRYSAGYPQTPPNQIISGSKEDVVSDDIRVDDYVALS